MPSESSSLLPKRGEYQAPKEGALRSPCPLVNSLANHGYINRSGRNIESDQLAAAMNEIGLSTALGAVFARPIFLEYRPPKNAKEAQLRAEADEQSTFIGRIWHFIRNPFAVLFASFGMRNHGQVAANGKSCLNLNQLGLNNVVEHDISLTRKDFAQGDNLTKQKELVDGLLKESSDGEKLYLEDMARYRAKRIATQREDNPEALYGPQQHQIACTEISLILDVFGDGKSIPCDYAHAIFKEERLPVKEGWTKRRWWTLGFIELGRTVNKVKAAVGLTIS